MADAVAEFYDPITGTLQVGAGLIGFFCKRTVSGTTQSRIGGNTQPSSLLVDVEGLNRSVVAVSINGFSAALTGTFALNGRRQMVFASDAPIGTGFNAYVYEWSAGMSEAGSLFTLRRDDGTTCFVSNQWPMKAVDILTIDESNGQPVVTRSGKQLAAACTTVGGHSRASGVYCARQTAGGPEQPPTVNDGGGRDGLDPSCAEVKGYVDGKLYGGQILDNGQTVKGVHVSWDDVFGTFGSYSDYDTYYAGGWASIGNVMVIDVTNIPLNTTFF